MRRPVLKVAPVNRTSSPDRPGLHPLLRTLAVLGLLYLFLVAIEMLGGTFKDLNRDQAKGMIDVISNPFAALSVGILATVLVQSSSVTTSTIVGAVGSLTLAPGGGTPDGLAEAVSPFVPMVMGANIGTTITNTLASMGSVTRSREFERAFAGATLHDFFNLLAAVVLLPVELATGFLSRSAAWLVGNLDLPTDAGFESPVKTAVKAGAGTVRGLLGDGLGIGDTVLAVLMIAGGVALIFVSLVGITRNMRRLVASRLERAINRALSHSALLGFVTGVLVTVAVQSSSITTSILVPMFAAGLLTLEGGFPMMLGANVGTTLTALLAAGVAGPKGLAVALVHLLFNVAGILMVYPFPVIRQIPMHLARGLARLTLRSRWWILVYVGGVFVALPLFATLLSGTL